MRFIQIVLHYSTMGMHSHRSSSESATRPNWSRGARGGRAGHHWDHQSCAYCILRTSYSHTGYISCQHQRYFINLPNTFSCHSKWGVEQLPPGSWSRSTRLGWINYYGNHRWLLFKLRRCLPACLPAAILPTPGKYFLGPKRNPKRRQTETITQQVIFL